MLSLMLTRPQGTKPRHRKAKAKARLMPRDVHEAFLVETEVRLRP